MKTEQKLLIDAECRNLVIAFSQALDDGDGDAAAALFSEDGIWKRAGVSLQGRDQIRDAVNERPRNVITRHCFTNTLITVLNENEAEGRSYYAVYRHKAAGDGDMKFPVPFDGPTRAGDYMNRFVRTDDGWRISFNAVRRLFER